MLLGAKLVLVVLSSSILWSTVMALPMRPPGTKARTPKQRIAVPSYPGYHEWVNVNFLDSSFPSVTNPSVGQSLAPTSSGQPHQFASDQGHGHQAPSPSTASGAQLPPDADKGKRLPPSALVYDSLGTRLISIPSNPNQLKAARRDKKSKKPHKGRPKEASWKDDYPNQIYKMSEILAGHLEISQVRAYRLLGKHGNHEIADGLISGNPAQEIAAALKIPISSTRISLRKRLLGDQAEGVTEKFRVFHGLTKKLANDRLGSALTPSLAALLLNPATFAQGAQKLKTKPRPRKNSVQRKAQVAAGASNALPASIRGADIVNNTSVPMQSSPSQWTLHEHQQQSMRPAASTSHEDDPDHIDFDAVMEWVHRNNHPEP